MKSGVIAGIALAVGMVSPLAMAADTAAGKDKAYTCVGCHGVPNLHNVYPTYEAPLIGGQSAQYIVAALKAYANGNRWHPTMQAQAKALSDEDMADIAAYLASLGK